MVAYKEKYVDKVISVVSNYQRYAHIAGVDAYWGHQIKKETMTVLGCYKLNIKREYQCYIEYESS